MMDAERGLCQPVSISCRGPVPAHSRINSDLAPSLPAPQGLCDPRYEHDSCGVGFIADIKGRKSHQIVRDGLSALHNLNHRGACGCENYAGDGAGILVVTQFLGALFSGCARHCCMTQENSEVAVRELRLPSARQSEGAGRGKASQVFFHPMGALAWCATTGELYIQG